MPKIIKHFNIRIYGYVQGVFFRASARDIAGELSISGTVRNEMDGSVYIEAEGEPENLQELVAWCKQGPERALVSKVDVEEKAVKQFKEFRIIR